MKKLVDYLSKLYTKKIMSIIMSAFLLCTLAMLYFFREYWMTPSRVFHISTELLAMCVLFVFYRLHFNKSNTEVLSEKIFVILCILLYLCMFLDCISWIIDGSIKYAWLNWLSNGLVFILEFVHGMVFIEYIYANIDKIDENTTRIIKVFRYIVIGTFFILCILVVSGAYYTIDDMGNYIMSDISLVSFFFVPIATLFACGIAAGASIKPNKLIMLLSYPLSSLGMSVIAVVNVDYANSLLTLFLSMILIYCSLFASANEEKINLNKVFQTYISDDVLNNVDKGELTAKSSISTLMFCDLHNFSLDMESMDPEDTVIVLNNFYNQTASIVENNNGKLLEFPGYGLFCIFLGENHAMDAVNAGKEIMDKLVSVNKYNVENHYPKFRLGIGINTGDVVIGNVGSHNHIRYSAMGKTVNLASRTSLYAEDGMIALTQNTKDFLKEKVDVVLVGKFVPKGLREPINIYSIKR